MELLFDLQGRYQQTYMIEGDPRSFIETALHVIKHGICMIGDGAVAGGIIIKFPFNRKILIGNVLFWNFTRPSGAAIFMAIALEFEKHGATYVSASSQFPENRIGDFYCKRGLKAVETNWLARIDHMKQLAKTEKESR